MTQDPQGLRALGAIYLIFSLLAVVVCVVAAIAVSGPARMWFVAGAVGTLFQGLVVMGVFSWMSQVAVDTASIRAMLENDLPDMKRAVSDLRELHASLAPQANDLERLTTTGPHAPIERATTLQHPAKEGPPAPAAVPANRRNTGLKAAVIIDKEGVRRCGRCRGEFGGDALPPECPSCGASVLP